jgi:O-antigen ligase
VGDEDDWIEVDHAALADGALQKGAPRRGGLLRVPPVVRRHGWLRLLLRLHVLLGLLYAVAICFERVVNIEILKPYRLIGAAIVLLMMVRGRLRLDRLERLAIAFIVSGFLLALLQTMLASESFIRLFMILCMWSFNLATFIALSSLLKDRREIILIAVVHALAMLVAAYGISSSAMNVADEMGISSRISGDFRNPANACVSMLFSCMVLLTVLRRRVGMRGPLTRLFKVAAMFVIPLYYLYTSSLTGSRAGAGLLLVGLAVYCVSTSLRRMAVALSFLAILAGIAYSIAPQDMNLAERNILALRVQKKGLDTDRLYLWRAGLDAYVDTYGLGLGMSRYQNVHRKYFAPYALKSDPRWEDTDLTLHNDYVSALVEFGAVGFVIFVFFCRCLVRMARGIADRDVRAIAISLLVGLAINGLSHTGLSYFAAWFYFALLSAWVRLERSPSAITPRPVVPWQTR